MPFTNEEFEELLSDPDKIVAGDVKWCDDEDHSPAKEFTLDVATSKGHPLFVRGSYNHEAKALSYVMILKGTGRVYALDLGKDHRNPSTGQLVGEKHKHRWSEENRDKEAYVPKDITEPATDPPAVWKQFCVEAGLKHEGDFPSPVPQPGFFE
ncbi:DUF6978 family protein [Anatilimnocola floriformis]|uniref:DUF6978 family protein n=1 Tax=Anatilimnocola floriformis TaxID=2948575 RepID=UPI0020C2824D|nr:hypothetical protein [Anatilimnocola floriformis]